MLLIDIEKLAEITSMSKRFLEEHVLGDPRMRVLERRKSRKRWWIYEPAMEALLSIVNDW